MSQFRLVILDYAKNQLDDPKVQKTLNEIIFAKQRNFLRTDPNYVVMDKHDMIGTHALIYDTSNFFESKLIFAIRVTFEARANQYKINTPLSDLKKFLPFDQANHLDSFQKHRGLVADCNSWFVDPDFSLKKSGLRLSDIGYTMIYLHVHRMGYDHIIGCTNEKYKAHRWLENIGEFKKDLIFEHPTVKDPHMLILIEKFNVGYLKETYIQNEKLFNEIVDLMPKSQHLMSISQTIDKFLLSAAHFSLEVA